MHQNWTGRRAEDGNTACRHTAASFDGPRHADVIEWRRSTEPPGQTLLRADIVAREHVQPAKSSSTDTYSAVQRPTPRSSRNRARTSGVAVTARRVEVDFAVVDSASEGEQSAHLLAAEPDRAQTGRRASRHIARPWETRTGRPGPLPTSHVAQRGQAIEQFETDDERELLAREAVDERLEHSRKPRRLHTTEPIRQFSSRRSRCATRYHSERSMCSPSSRSTMDRTWRPSDSVRSDGVAVTMIRGTAGEPDCRMASSVTRLPTITIRRYVVPSHRSMALRGRRRSAHTVKSRRNGGIGRMITEGHHTCGRYSSIRSRWIRRG